MEEPAESVSLFHKGQLLKIPEESLEEMEPTEPTEELAVLADPVVLVARPG